MKLARQLWYILNRRERIEGSILFCGMALGALLEAVSIGLVAPFIALLTEPKRVFEAPVIQHALAALHIRSSQQLLVVLGLGLVVIFVLKSTYLVLLYRALFRYVYDKHANLTRQLLTGYLSAPYALHLQRNTAELIKGTTETMERFITGFLTMLLVVIGELLVVVALTLLLVIVKPLATLVGVVVLGGPTVLLYRAMQRRLASAGHLAETSMAAMIQWTEQAVSGIKEILVMDRTGFFIDRHSYHTRQFANSWRSFTLLSNVPRFVIDTLAVSVLVTVTLIVLVREQDPQSILPVMGIFAVAALRLMPSINRIAHGLTLLRFHYITTDVIYRELRQAQQNESADARPAARTAVAAPLRFAQSLALEHLSFHYPKMPQLAVDNVSLEIPRGHWIAFVGPTGAGKTTLGDLILGLFTPTAGRITVDGRDLRDDIAAWQRDIGYVPQDVYLMDDNVRRNVAFGLPDQDIDDDRVWQALAAAQVETRVRSLPGGLGALVGQRGDRLSGGERQRLGLARALYLDPPVLVVDEGTANLDNETEAAVARTLANRRGEKTIIVIAHRLALVRDCDRIYLMRHGKVESSGTYSDLLRTDNGFRQLADPAR